MKKLLLTITLFLAVTIVFAQAESHLEASKKKVPSVELKDVNGKLINTGELDNEGHPIVISFWATWCTPCKKELNTIHEEFVDWVDETGVRLIAVSIDDERTKSRVVPYVDSKGWEYDILLDPNGEFKRAMGVNNVPHTFVIDGEGNIVYSHNSYVPGDEIKLYEVLVELSSVK